MKLEDLPMYIPLIKIKDMESKKQEPRFFGNDVHDTLVVDPFNRELSYYNCQCGDGSEYGGYEFEKQEPTCIDDDFYSRWCENICLDDLVKDHDKEVRKQVCDEIKKKFGYKYNKQLVVSSYQLCKFLDQIEKGSDGYGK